MTNDKFLTEAFKSLDILNEEEFYLSSKKEINDLEDFMHQPDDEVEIIDVEATSEEELQPSYLGEVILQCPVCKTLIYKHPDEVHLEADEDVANTEEECPFCYTTRGYKIVGMVAPFVKEEEEEVKEEPEEVEVKEIEEISEGCHKEVNEEVEDKIISKREVWGQTEESPYDMAKEFNLTIKKISSDADETLYEFTGKIKDFDKAKAAGYFYAEDYLEESIENISIETEDEIMTMTSEEDGKVVVTTEPKEEIEEETIEVEETEEIKEVEETEEVPEEETIVPVDDEIQAEINPVTEVEEESEEEEKIEETEEEVSEEEPEEEKVEETEEEIGFEEFDEEEFDQLGEAYLKKVYENVTGYKTQDVAEENGKLVIEGIINFDSGNSKKTTFVFENIEKDEEGNIKLIGENLEICKGNKAYTLSGKLSDKGLIAESLVYNYRSADKDNNPIRIFGKVVKK